MKLKRNTGITLIALVVTIIVLLILAGVTFSLALNSNGVFQRSKNAAAAYSEAEEAEREELDRIAEEMDEVMKEKISWEIVNDSDENEIISVGDELKASTGENFYVIKTDNDIITLLSKYNLATSKNESGKYYQQNATKGTTACAFSNSQYWTTTDINSAKNYSTGDAQEKTMKYAKEYGGTGRLLIESEAATLRRNEIIKDIILGKDSIDGYLYFWIGNADDTDINIVCYIWGDKNTFSFGNFKFNRAGVRPAIEMPISNF